MHQCRLRCGERRVGSITKIRAAGFNGIAATTWAAVVPTMSGKSNAGARCVVTSHRSRSTVRKVKPSAARGNDKLYFTGPTTHVRSNGTKDRASHGWPKADRGLESRQVTLSRHEVYESESNRLLHQDLEVPAPTLKKSPGHAPAFS